MHFTYSQDNNESGDLQQGDILKRTPALTEIVGKIHPYYLKDDYTNFMILTQTCDLVRRAPSSELPYISICAIRPLSLVLEKEAERYQNALLRRANAVSDRNRPKLSAFIERLLNNNVSNYFYLHEEPSVGVQSSCAFLRLSIALKAEHYTSCLSARAISLTPNFQAKLGWLVGNIYSRVGTEDWVPNAKTADEWQAFIKQVLEENLVFLPDRQLREFQRNADDAQVSAMNVNQIREAVRGIPSYRRKDEVIDIVVSQLSEAGMLEAAVIERARARLKNNSKLAALVAN